MTGMMCKHCGGRVDAEGYSMGGSIDEDVEYRTDFPDDADGDYDDREREQTATDEFADTDQQEATIDMRDRAFAEAFASMQHGESRVSNSEPPKPAEQSKSELEAPEGELAAKKRARYGFMGGR